MTAGHMQRIKDIASCPTQFQQHIPGADYRVHIVGKEIFACRIIAEADDYRYQRHGVDIQACDLPGGLDLRLTSDGSWYCFEVNPSPVFTFFQGATGQPIARAVAALLESGVEEENNAILTKAGAEISLDWGVSTVAERSGKGVKVKMAQSGIDGRFF